VPGDDDDGALVARVQSGDRKAFGELVRRHREPVARLVRRWVRDDEAAEDVTQQVFLRALRGIEGFRRDASFSTWLHRIAQNAAKNHARDAKRTVAIEDVELITNALGTGRMAAREARARLGAALEQLPPKQRMTVELRLVHELPFRAIAEMIGSTEEAARANYQHAVKRLREITLG